MPVNRRWICKEGKFGENPKIDAFLAEILEVSKKHGMLISHEDSGGAFEIVAINPKTEKSHISWLMGAHDRTGE